VAQKAQLAESKAYCDVGIFGLLIGDNLHEMEPMRDAGMAGFKCFLGESVGNPPTPSDGALLDALATAVSLDRRVGFHAESNAILQHRIRQRRGHIGIGADADLTIVDPDRPGAIRAAGLHNKHPMTPSDGWAITAQPVTTIVRGHIMMWDGAREQPVAGCAHFSGPLAARAARCRSAARRPGGRRSGRGPRGRRGAAAPG
jgi:dihydroorotase-like cyclic amidohydrolase